MGFAKKALKSARDYALGPVGKRTVGSFENTISQLHLTLAYRQIAGSGGVLPALSDTGFTVYSADDVDGILLFVFAVIGTTNKKCVEICAGDGIQCNTANLIINHGWTGLLVDGNADSVERARHYYGINRSTAIYPPTIVNSWVTRSNVNDLLENNGFAGPIDLLVIDMDGVDYWIWDALDVIKPRVVVAEYQDIIGADKALTVPYSDDFNARNFPTTNGLPNFGGASLLALAKLAASKGYRLVGRSRCGVDAIFVRSDLGVDHIPDKSVAECLDHPKSIRGRAERFPTVEHLPWVEV